MALQPRYSGPKIECIGHLIGEAFEKAGIDAKNARVLQVEPRSFRLNVATDFVSRFPPQNADTDSRPFHIVDLDNFERLPYGDNEFDFVYVRRTLEATSNPGWICKEMERVGRRGLIECASPVTEITKGVGRFHKLQSLGYPESQYIVMPTEVSQGSDGTPVGVGVSFVPKLPVIEHIPFKKIGHDNFLRQLLKSDMMWTAYFPWEGAIDAKTWTAGRDYRISKTPPELPFYGHVIRDAIFDRFIPLATTLNATLTSHREQDSPDEEEEGAQTRSSLGEMTNTFLRRRSSRNIAGLAPGNADLEDTFSAMLSPDAVVSPEAILSPDPASPGSILREMRFEGAATGPDLDASVLAEVRVEKKPPANTTTTTVLNGTAPVGRENDPDDDDGGDWEVAQQRHSKKRDAPPTKEPNQDPAGPPKSYNRRLNTTDKTKQSVRTVFQAKKPGQQHKNNAEAAAAAPVKTSTAPPQKPSKGSTTSVHTTSVHSTVFNRYDVLSNDD
jgi:hypothetical protein